MSAPAPNTKATNTLVQPVLSCNVSIDKIEIYWETLRGVPEEDQETAGI